MTTTELVIKIQHRLQKVSGNAYEEIYPEEVLLSANSAQMHLLGRYVSEPDGKTRREQLSHLLEPLDPQASGERAYGDFTESTFLLPQNVWTIESVDVFGDARYENLTATRRLNVRPVGLHELPALLDNPFTRPSPEVALALLTNGKITLYTQRYGIQSIEGWYIKLPKNIALNEPIELPERLHEKLISETLAIMTGDIPDERHQIVKQESISTTV